MPVVFCEKNLDVLSKQESQQSLTNSEASSVLPTASNFERPPNYKFNTRMIVRETRDAQENDALLSGANVRAKRHPGANMRSYREKHEWMQILTGADGRTEGFNQQMLFAGIDWKASASKFFPTNLLEESDAALSGTETSSTT